MSRSLAFVFGIASLFAALWVLSSAGLPQRADYTGQEIGGIGRVAPEIGSLAPPFALDTLEGDSFNLLDAQGESLVLNFWATWCVPCRAEMPELQQIHDEELARVIGVNLGESPQQIMPWMADLDLDFEILLDLEEEIAGLYRIRGQPTTILIAPDGIITHIIYGATNADALRNALQTH